MAVKEQGKRDEESYEMVYGSTADQLKQYTVNILPPLNIWVELRPGLEFMQTSGEEEQHNANNKEAASGPKKTVIIFHFQTDQARGEKYIDDFINVRG